MDLVEEQEALQSAVDELLGSCNIDDDRQVIVEQFAVLKAKLASVRKTVQHKVAVHNILREHSQARAAIRDTTAHLQERLKGELSAEALSGLQSDLDRVRSDVMNLEAHHPEIEALLFEAGITVLDRGTERVMDMKDGVKKLLSDIDNDEKKLKLCLQIFDLNFLLSSASSKLNEISVVYLDDGDALRTAVEVSYCICFQLLFVTHL